jgi:hypothetical protein
MADHTLPKKRQSARPSRSKAALNGLRSKAEIEGLRETRFLLRSPKNAARLRAGLAEVRAGKLIERELEGD